MNGLQKVLQLRFINQARLPEQLLSISKYHKGWYALYLVLV